MQINILALTKGLYTSDHIFRHIVFSFQQKITRYGGKRQGKTQSKETKQASISDKGEILVLPDRKFKMSIINLQRALIKRIDNMQEQISNASKKDGNPRKESKKKNARIRNSVKELKNAFDGFIIRVDTAEGRISKLEDM